MTAVKPSSHTTTDDNNDDHDDNADNNIDNHVFNDAGGGDIGNDNEHENVVGNGTGIDQIIDADDDDLIVDEGEGEYDGDNTTERVEELIGMAGGYYVGGWEEDTIRGEGLIRLTDGQVLVIVVMEVVE